MIGRYRTLILLTLLTSAQAQTPTSKPAAAEKPESAATQEAKALEARLPAPVISSKETFEVTPAQKQRLEKLLPETFRRLTQREPLHLLALGAEDMLAMWTEDGKARVEDSFPAIFAKQLATQFYYTAGVSLADRPQVTSEANPGITLRFISRPEGNVLDAASVLASTARQAPVNLVMICYGQAEAEAGMSPVAFAQAVRRGIEAAAEIGAEVILCAPWLPVAEKAEFVLGTARPLSDRLHDLAEDEGVMFADLGDLSRVLALPSESDQADVGLVFERFATLYRGYFHLGSDGRFEPRESLHQRLGTVAFQELLNGPNKLPWTLADVTPLWQKDGTELSVDVTVVNESAQRLDLTLLPLIATDWKPLEVNPQVSLPASGRKTLTLKYARASKATLAQEESEVRLPLLVLSAKQARIETLSAPVQPLSILWTKETFFNQEKKFTPICQILNTSRSSIRGTWEASFSGKILQGRFDLVAGATQPLDLSFELPTESIANAPLNLTVKTDAFSLQSGIAVTLSRNLGLSQPVPLKSDSNTTGQVSLRNEADASHLKLICEVQGPDLLVDTAAAGTPSWQLEVNLDARSYGKRLEPGSTATLSTTGSHASGPGKTHPISAWAFGTGYAAAFSAKEITASLTAPGNNSHQLTLTLPRTYLYLHEWALDNGNSQLGLNVRLTLNTSQGYKTWTLHPTSKAAESIEALSVLELTTAPTTRMTVDLH